MTKNLNVHGIYLKFCRQLGIISVEPSDSTRKIHPVTVISATDNFRNEESDHYKVGSIVTGRIVVLFAHFSLHAIYTMIRAFQYTFFAENREVVWVTASWAWVWLSFFGGTSYYTFFHHKDQIVGLHAEWQDVDARILECKTTTIYRK